MKTCINPPVFRSQIGRSLLYTAESYRLLERENSERVETPSEKVALSDKAVTSERTVMSDKLRRIASPTFGRCEGNDGFPQAEEPVSQAEGEERQRPPVQINGYFLTPMDAGTPSRPALGVSSAGGRKPAAWSMADAERQATDAHLYEGATGVLTVLTDLRAQTRSKRRQSQANDFQAFMSFLQA